jgi:hypothetical protein
MADGNQQPGRVKPSEERGDTALHDNEACENGPWTGTAGQVIDRRRRRQGTIRRLALVPTTPSQRRGWSRRKQHA